MRIRLLPVAIGISVMTGFAASCAHADIYGYVDADGVAHFATEKLDERYQLFMLDGASSASPQPTQADPAKAPLLNYLSQHPNLKKYEALLNEAAREFALEPALLKAVMAAESGFNPAAVSPKGAIGLMQVMPATAQRYGLRSDGRKTVAQKLADPQTNIRLGARYLRDLHRMFPAEPNLVLASYNAGEGAVQKYRNQVPPYPETRNYVRLVTQFYRLYKPSSEGIAITTVSGNGAGANRTNRIRTTIPARRNEPATILE